MADVSPGSGGPTDRPRGQLILITAVVLAVTLVGVAVVLNSAIFAENVATRENNGASGDATAFQSAARAAVSEAFESANREHAGDLYPELRDDHYRPSTEYMAERLAERGAVGGTMVDLTPTGSREGTQLVESDRTTDLTPHGGAPTDWRVAASAHVRSFEATVEPTDGAVGTSTVVDQVTGGSTVTFAAELDPESGTTHRVAVYEDTDGGAVRVLVQEVGGGYEECTAVGTTANISLTGRPTVDGSYCDALEPVATTDGLYNVSFAGSDLAVGTYRLVVDHHKAGLDRAVDRTNYGPACAGATYHDDPVDDPHSVPAIYAATIETTYRTQQVAVERTERIVPAQAGEGPTVPLFTDVTVTDNSDSTAGGTTDLTVGWTVSDPNGDLEEVDIEIRNDDDDTTLLTDSQNVSGGTASGSFGATASDDSGDEYVVELTVSDGNDERIDKRREIADGDGTGCPR